MDEVLKGGTGAVFLFLYLFPGFLGSLVYDFLVESRKRDIFERIVAALVLTLLSSVTLKVGFGVPLLPLAMNNATPVSTVVNAFFGRNLLFGSMISLTIVVALTISNNTGFTYRALNWLRLSTKASSVDVWADTFDRLRGNWIRIRFSDGRLLVGWPKFYSQFGDPREIFLADASWWIPDESGTLVAEDVPGAGVYIADFSRVEAIEVLK